MSRFKVISEDYKSSARRGTLATSHGVIETPLFMPVGTRGCVKGLTPRQLKETGSSVLLANTYHILLRPGVEAVESLGGLHRLMGWEGPLLTDSGGYQIFSLSTLSRVDDDGVEFASHIDGQKIYLNAESATSAQNRLGGDIIMCFDECTPYGCERERVEKAVDRTVRWAQRCRESNDNDRQLLFGIVQGGIDFELRSRCTEALVKLDFDGYAVGGLSVGEGHGDMIRTTEHTAALLPVDKPRYLMGAGRPEDIIAAVGAGIDMFDCVLPTRNGRNAFAFTEAGAVRLRNSSHTEDQGPIEVGCDCYCCSNFSRAALRHFFNVGEMLGPILVSIHNIRFYQHLMGRIRESIENGTFADLAQGYCLHNI